MKHSSPFLKSGKMEFYFLLKKDVSCRLREVNKKEYYVIKISNIFYYNIGFIIYFFFFLACDFSRSCNNVMY